MTNLKVGDRVRVKSNWNWPKDSTGVVAVPPPSVQALVADEHPWHGHTRTVKGKSRNIVFVWVVFDQPQTDGDDDGPYRGGEVEIEFVTRVD